MKKWLKLLFVLLLFAAISVALYFLLTALEITNLNNKIIKLKSDELYEKQLRDKYKEIDEQINKEIESEESFSKLVQLLIERVVVHKIDGDRRKVKLDIYANIVGKKLTVYNKTVLNETDSSLCSHKENNDMYSSLRKWKYI